MSTLSEALSYSELYSEAKALEKERDKLAKALRDIVSACGPEAATYHNAGPGRMTATGRLAKSSSIARAALAKVEGGAS